MITDIIWGIISGAVIGIIARLLLPGRQNIGMLWTVILGILGSVLAGVVANAFGVGDTRGVDWIRHIIQIAFAMLFIWLFVRLRSGRTPTNRQPSARRMR
jgi:uncharacterized membrane protein YeaQ/YmgE (transglycosylase-associated protein family)